MGNFENPVLGTSLIYLHIICKTGPLTSKNIIMAWVANICSMPPLNLGPVDFSYSFDALNAVCSLIFVKWPCYGSGFFRALGRQNNQKARGERRYYDEKTPALLNFRCGCDRDNRLQRQEAC